MVGLEGVWEGEGGVEIRAWRVVLRLGREKEWDCIVVAVVIGGFWLFLKERTFLDVSRWSGSG